MAYNKGSPPTRVVLVDAADESDYTAKTSGTGTSAMQVQGPAADDAAAAANPLPIGGKYFSTADAVDANDIGYFAMGQRRRLLVGHGKTSVPVYGRTAVVWPGSDNSDGEEVAPLAVAVSGVNGSSTVDLTPGDTHGLVVAHGLASTFWNYSNGASGILSNTTTAVTIKTAGAASVRNYIDSLQITTTAFGVSVPIAIRDGAGGTVLWAMNVPTGGFLDPVTVIFRTPLRGTAATLLEVLTTTANTSGTVWISVQGHAGA